MTDTRRLTPEQAALLALLDKVEALEAAVRKIGRRLDRLEENGRLARRSRRRESLDCPKL